MATKIWSEELAQRAVPYIARLVRDLKRLFARLSGDERSDESVKTDYEQVVADLEVMGVEVWSAATGTVLLKGGYGWLVFMHGDRTINRWVSGSTMGGLRRRKYGRPESLVNFSEPLALPPSEPESRVQQSLFGDE